MIFPVEPKPDWGCDYFSTIRPGDDVAWGCQRNGANLYGDKKNWELPLGRIGSKYSELQKVGDWEATEMEYVVESYQVFKDNRNVWQWLVILDEVSE